MAVELAEKSTSASVSPSGEAWQRLKRNPVAVVSGVLILLLLLVAIFAPLIATHTQDAQDREHILISSGYGHRLGTDNLGRDTFSRLIYGARISLAVGVVVELIEIVIGVSLGLMAAYKGGWWDTLLMRFTDAMFAFPDLLFAILLVGIFQPKSAALSFLTVFIALALVNWPGMARLVRGQALALRDKEFVDAARSIGVTGWGIVTRHLLPNMLGPIVVAVTVNIANVILAEATLSFLGIGSTDPSYPSWGRMISTARDYLRGNPQLILYPSFALAITVVAFNFFGDALRDALDPRLRK